MEQVWEFAVYAPDGHRLYESAAAELDLPPWKTVQALAVDPDTYPGVHIAVVPDGRAVYVLREDGLWMVGLAFNGRGFLAVRYRPHAWRRTARQLASILTTLPPGMVLQTKHQTPAGVEEGDGHAAGLVTVLCLQAMGAWSYPSWWTEDAGTNDESL